MKDSHYRVSLDIHSTQSQVSLPIKQGDTSRKVFISLCEGGKPYHIEDDCFAVFSAKKPDKTKIENNCVIADNVIEYSVTEQTSAASGKLDCEIKLYGGDNGLLCSPRFTIIVDARAVSDAEIESTSEYSALTELYNETNTLKDEVETKLANGEFDGEDVNYNLVSNALKGTASGEIVTLTDVSPVEHEMKVKAQPGARITKCGANLIPIEFGRTLTKNGVTLTVGENGVFSLKGTATANADFAILSGGKTVAVKSGQSYTISSGLTGSSNNTYQMFALSVNKTFTDMYDIGTRGVTFTPTSDDRVNILMLVYSGVTVDLKLYPMLNMGTTSMPFEPYKQPVEFDADENGTTVTSLYPTTIFLTDTEGVVIEAEYNRDANKVVADLLSRIEGSAGKIGYIDLQASKWQGSESLYSQVVAIDGVTANSKVDINPSIEQLAIFHQKDIAFVAENVDGVVTVYCVGQKPTANYQMQITITEVIANG